MTARRRAVATIAAVGLSVALLVVGLAGGYFAAVTTTPPQVVEKQVELPTKTIKIGMTISKSGPFAPLDSDYDKFNKAWQDWINEQNLVINNTRVKFEVTSLDDSSDPGKAVQLYTRLATQDKVDILVSPYSADIGLQLIPIAEQNQVPMIMAEASTARMWTGENHWISTSMVPYWEKGTNGWSASYFQMLESNKWAKTIAFVGWDITWASDDHKSSVALAKQIGLDVVYDVLLQPNFANPDFTAQITTLKGLNPDIVYLSMFGPFSAIFIKQANDQGFRPKEWHSIEWGASFLPTLGSLAEGATSEIFWTPNFNFYQTDIFKQLLNQAGMDWKVWQWIELRMIIFQMIVQALHDSAIRNPSDPFSKASINDALHKLQMMTISGPLITQPQGYGTVGLVPIQIQNGKIVTIWPTNLADARYVHP